MERPEPVPVPSGAERDGEGRALEALAQPCRDQPDNAGVPVGRGEDEHGRPVAAADLGFGGARSPPPPPRSSMRWRSVLSSLSWAAMIMRLLLVVEREQARAECGIADAAAGIDARADEEAEMIGVERPGEPRRQRQGADAACWSRYAPISRPRATKARLRPVSGTTSQTVAERDEVDHRHQVGQPAVPALAQQAVDGHQHHEGDTGGAEVAEAGDVVGPVGVHQRAGGRQLVVGEMMVDHQHVEAALACMGDGLVAGGAAVERHQQLARRRRSACRWRRCWARSPRRCGRGYGPAASARNAGR